MSVSKNLKEIKGRMRVEADVSGRVIGDVQLIAVSKRQADARISEALAAGHRVFGENRVQEAQAHWLESGYRAAYPDLELHLIGGLQTNKAAEAVALFDVLETLDREKLARALAREMKKQARDVPCFIQVNTGDEAQKGGVTVSDLADFYAFCTAECDITVRGLMCIPPVDEPAALHFALLKKHADRLGLDQLSMGMSGDFEKAIALGATHVRVGSAIFGARD